MVRGLLPQWLCFSNEFADRVVGSSVAAKLRAPSEAGLCSSSLWVRLISARTCSTARSGGSEARSRNRVHGDARAKIWKKQGERSQQCEC